MEDRKIIAGITQTNDGDGKILAKLPSHQSDLVAHTLRGFAYRYPQFLVVGWLTIREKEQRRSTVVMVRSHQPSVRLFHGRQVVASCQESIDFRRISSMDEPIRVAMIQ